MFVPEFPEAPEDTGGEEEDEHFEIKEKGGPCGGLVL
jgi:hypothetical protein